MSRSETIVTLLATCLSIIVTLPVIAIASDEEADARKSFLSDLPIETHGFYEMRGGYRLQNDKYEKDMSIMENRFQLDLFSYLDWGDFKFKGDFIGDLVTEQGLADEVVVWGSSYSGALVFRLAAENEDRIAGVIAFSPASGGPMVDCRARNWAGHLSVPVAVFRPRPEMERESSLEQRQVLTAAGADFHVVEHGVHGSSMLLDARTGHDMGVARRAVVEWLEETFGAGSDGHVPQAQSR